MYRYLITGYTEDCELYHDQKFTQREFIDMCCEADRAIKESWAEGQQDISILPLIRGKRDGIVYISSFDVDAISEKLVESYGFCFCRFPIVASCSCGWNEYDRKKGEEE